MVTSPTNPAGLKRPRSGFTLIELLAVMAIAVIVMTLVVPAVIGMNHAGDVTNASYLVSGALDTARAYAKANSTYVWVGLFEENEAISPPSPAVAGVGRVDISIVASNDGTTVYNASALTSAGSTQQPFPANRLSQLGKLIHIDNIHLTGYSDPVSSVAGTGATFQTRPAVGDMTAKIGGSMQAVSATPFYYPVSATSGNAQYTFVEAVEFSPRGEARLNNASSGYKPVIEIGLQGTHGTTPDSGTPDNTNNPAAVQVTGIMGTVTIYRK